jgi:hypothetical protein
MKLQASSLLYVLIIIVVLALTSTALITLSGYQKMLFERDGLQALLHRQAVAGMAMLLNSGPHADRQPMLIPLGKDLEDTLSLALEAWGAFDLANVNVWHHTAWRREQVSLTGLVGLVPDSIGQAALYLPDHAQALSLVGHSRLRGAAYLPRGSIRSGMVDTRGFSGIRLLEGIERRSGRYLPPIDTARIRVLQAVSMLKTKGIGKVPPSAYAPFDSLAMRLTGRIVRLDGQHLEGKIIVVADSLIRVGRAAQLKDILLFAPVIQIDSGFAGSIQAFATSSIKLGNGVTLSYPSVLAVLGDRKMGIPGSLTIGERCTVEGMVLAWGDGTRKELLPKTNIGKGTVIMGQVYADGWLDLKGTVHGNVTCRDFLLQTPTSIYENHIMDATIDISKRTLFFVGTMFIGDRKTKKGLVKWLRK